MVRVRTESLRNANRRFGTRSLLILLTIVGLALGWNVRRARIQATVIEEIRAAGGTIYYDFQWDGGNYWPQWLIDLVGIDFLAHVVAVDMTAHMHDFSSVTQLRYLRTLWLPTPEEGFLSEKWRQSREGRTQLQRLQQSLPRCHISY